MRDEMERQAQMGGTEEVKKEVNQEAEDAKCDAESPRSTPPRESLEGGQS